MWEVVSNISSIITCILFILYIIGRIWKIFVTKNLKYEKFIRTDTNTEFGINSYDNVIFIDDEGEEFSISSSYGIRCIKFYKLSYRPSNNSLSSLASKKLVHTHKNLNINDLLYVRCDLGECVPSIQICIERMDYVKVIFELYSSGRTGNILVRTYKYKMTIRSLIYYLCV